MTDRIARLFNKVCARVGQQAFTPIVGAYGRGYIANVTSGKAAVRKNTRDAEPTPGFDVPPLLDPQQGDYFLFYELGSDRVLLHPLDRNAATDWNPLREPGQMIMAADDGTATIIDPPDDPTIRHQLRWPGDTHQPAWLDASVDGGPPPSPTGSVPTKVAGLAMFATTTTSIALTWDEAGAPADHPVTAYKVTRNGSLIASPLSTAYTDVGLTPSTDYTYTVTATNGAGDGLASDPLTITTAASTTTGSAFPRMTMIWPAWASTLALVQAVVDDFVYMQQEAVVLRGMAWGSDYLLPSDVSAKLDLFIDAGITPYLGLWVGHLTEGDRTVGLRAWNAGEGKWAGVVFDAENQWVQHCQSTDKGGVGTIQAKADFDGFMAVFRPLTDQLAVICYAAPTSFPNYHYDWWNDAVDTFLPAAFFSSSSDTAAAILNTTYRKFAAVDWTSPMKPIVPLMNGYKSTLSDADVAKRSDYIDLALAKAGAVGIWRWIDDFPENMRAMLHAY